MLVPGGQIKFIVPKGLLVKEQPQSVFQVIDATASASIRVVMQAVRTSSNW